MLIKLFNYLFGLNRHLKKLIIIPLDILIVITSLFISLKLRLDYSNFILEEKFWLVCLLISSLSIFSNLYFGLYIPVIRFISGQIIKTIFKCSLFLTFFMVIISQISYFEIPRTVPFIFLVVSFMMIGGLRVLIKLIFLNLNKLNKKRVAIFGTNVQGRQLLSLLYQSTLYNPILFFSDNLSIVGSEISGLKVYSFKKDFNLLSKYKIDTLLITSKNQSINIKDQIIHLIQNYPLEIKSVLDPNSIVKSVDNLNLLKNITIEDLMDRKPIKPKQALMKKYNYKKIILISGAGGSIGSEIGRQILKLSPKAIILLDHSEYALYKICEELNIQMTKNKFNVMLKPILGSVQDTDLLEKIFSENEISIVFHAAAYKHVDLVEKNIFVSIKNNIFGTEKICSISKKFKVENFVLISSDKAVRPTNYMGATKRVAELICQSHHKKDTLTKFSIVRFGNVIGSSGSVIPKFESQIKNGGPVTVTHENVKRYFMTIKEAAELVIQSVALAKGNDIFILDMGQPIKIIDLAKKIISLKGLIPYISLNKDQKSKYPKNDKIIEIKFSGLKKGEKMFEELMVEDTPKKTSHPRIFLVSEKSLDKKLYIKFMHEIKKYTDLKNIEKINNVLKHQAIGMKK